jgi:hypothetical protein
LIRRTGKQQPQELHEREQIEQSLRDTERQHEEQHNKPRFDTARLSVLGDFSSSMRLRSSRPVPHSSCAKLRGCRLTQ